MGKTKHPLVLWVSETFQQSEWARDLENKGHKVVYFDAGLGGSEHPDLILSPVAHFWDARMDGKLLDVALKTARKNRYSEGRKKA